MEKLCAFTQRTVITMNTEARIKALNKLGTLIDKDNGLLAAAVTKACFENPWFTPEDYWYALIQIRENYLKGDLLFEFAMSHKLFRENPIPKAVGLVMAGNIPCVGFHDILCTFLCGHHSLVKLSQKDEVVLPMLYKMWQELIPEIQGMISFVEKLKNFDAVIATGSNNTARYFEYYFKKYPHIIRKNRNGVGVLTGKESEDDLKNLAEDTLRYFGMGCRNLSKIYVPSKYQFNDLLDAMKTKEHVIEHDKYKHNYDYNLAILQINQEQYMTNGSIILLKKQQIPSRISTLHFQPYDSLVTLTGELEQHQDQIQCVVCSESLKQTVSLLPGTAQIPQLNDFADGVNTMEFLIHLPT